MFERPHYYSILSLDGGGIRGIIPCMVLMEIEKRTGTPIAQLFDLISGTSTGGMLAAGLTVKDSEGNPAFPAEDLLGLYKGPLGKKIFAPPGGIFNGVRSLFRSKFAGENIEQVLKTKFGSARLRDSYTDLLITSYNTQEKLPFYFKTSDALEKEEENFYIWEVCRSTSAAPTYFPPIQLPYDGMIQRKKMMNGQETIVEESVKHLSLIDGGVFANNPSLLAYLEAKDKFKESQYYKALSQVLGLGSEEGGLEDEGADRGMFAEVESDDLAMPFLIVSIGTGQTRRPYPYVKARKWGMVKWVQPIVDILMQGVSESVHYQMQHLLPPSREHNAPRYVRWNIELDPDDSDMDNVKDDNLDRLAEYGLQLVRDNDQQIDEICGYLTDLAAERKKAVG